MPTFPLTPLQTVPRQIGRGVVFYAVESDPNVAGADPDPIVWDGESQLYLKQLGATEGNIGFTRNQGINPLTLPEESGGAIVEATHMGEAPTVDIPLFLADPDLLPIVDTRGVAHGGYDRVCPVAQRTIVIFPEPLLRTSEEPCAYSAPSWSSAEGWKVGGAALSEAQETLLEMVLWCWGGYFEMPSYEWAGEPGDGGKTIIPITFHCMVNYGLPNGHYLYTWGDPATYSIDLEGGS